MWFRHGSFYDSQDCCDGDGLRSRNKINFPEQKKNEKRKERKDCTVVSKSTIEQMKLSHVLGHENASLCR